MLPSEDDYAKDMGVWHVSFTLPQALAVPICGVALLDTFQRIGRDTGRPNLGLHGAVRAGVRLLCARHGAGAPGEGRASSLRQPSRALYGSSMHGAIHNTDFLQQAPAHPLLSGLGCSPSMLGCGHTPPYSLSWQGGLSGVGFFFFAQHAGLCVIPLCTLLLGGESL